MIISPEEAAGRTDYRSLAMRLGEERFRARIDKQAHLWTRDLHQGVGVWAVEAFLPLDVWIRAGLRLSGLAGIGLRNFLDVRVVENVVEIARLPEAFDGFRLLQIADLHCDLEPRLIDRVIAKLDGLDYDAVALTGDYQNKIAQNPTEALALMGRLLPLLRQPCFGIMGNHDFLEKVAFLESRGVKMLLNENFSIERDGRRLWFCGVDDPHFFRTEDLAKARTGVEKGETSVLLSHSPETYIEAEKLEYSFMISGHTHGGQFCLPGGVPIIRNTRVPRRMLKGAWRHGKLAGYTSPGTGGCQVAARFFCPPEMTLHILRRKSE